MHPTFNGNAAGFRVVVLALAASCWLITNVLAQELAPADAPAAFQQHVQKLRADFAREHPENLNDIEWVKARIALLAEIDQYGRTVLSAAMNPALLGSGRGADNPQALEANRLAGDLFQAMDTQNTAELKRLMARWGWFNAAKFGAETEKNAWLIVQHADLNPEFQREVLAIIEPLVQKGEADSKTYAYLFDRVAVSINEPSRTRPQRYGTQGRCVGRGQWEPFPVDDPEGLDERRKSVGLPPEDEYIAVFKERNLCP